MSAKLALALVLATLAAPLAAETIADRPGWVVIKTAKPYQQLIDAVKAAAKANKLGVVTEAGPTKVAANRGITIPGNRVIGLFNNDFAVKILATSTAAMIEAPVRVYVTQNSDGGATLSYKTPSMVFAPYLDEGGDALSELAQGLDARFDAVAKAATQ
ncbi:MAG: DUF302 domain-containing protein [Sedimentitalea sp.]